MSLVCLEYYSTYSSGDGEKIASFFITLQSSWMQPSSPAGKLASFFKLPLMAPIRQSALGSCRSSSFPDLRLAECFMFHLLTSAEAG